MQYTISEMAKIINISPHTLRYYAKEGLMPYVERSENGVRLFKEADFEWLFLIDCLKKAGMSIKDIRIFIEMAIQGDETIEERLAMFREQFRQVQARISELQETLDYLEYKCRYYEMAREYGSTAALKDLPADRIPAVLTAAREKTKSLRH